MNIVVGRDFNVRRAVAIKVLLLYRSLITKARVDLVRSGYLIASICSKTIINTGFLDLRFVIEVVIIIVGISRRFSSAVNHLGLHNSLLHLLCLKIQ